MAAGRYCAVGTPAGCRGSRDTAMDGRSRRAHGAMPDCGHAEPRRGTEWWGKSPFGYFWGSFPKVTRRKGGTNSRRDRSNGYVHNPRKELCRYLCRDAADPPPSRSSPLPPRPGRSRKPPATSHIKCRSCLIPTQGWQGSVLFNKFPVEYHTRCAAGPRSSATGASTRPSSKVG